MSHFSSLSNPHSTTTSTSILTTTTNSISIYTVNRSATEVEALEILSSYGKPWTFATAILSLILNTLTFAIVLHQRRTDHQSWGQLHLLCLAVSDLFIGFVYIWGCLWRFSLGGDSLVGVTLSPNFSLHYKIWAVFWVLGIGINRWLTLFFTCVKVTFNINIVFWYNCR